MFDVIEEILFTSKLDDEKRLKEIVSEQKSRTQMRLTTAGHSAAATRAMAYFSETAAFSDRSSGIDYYRMLDDLDANFETKKENLKSKLKELMNVIFRQRCHGIFRNIGRKGACRIGRESDRIMRKTFVG